jgi:ubiquitin C-terminal hydrolase
VRQFTNCCLCDGVNGVEPSRLGQCIYTAGEVVTTSARSEIKGFPVCYTCWTHFVASTGEDTAVASAAATATTRCSLCDNNGNGGMKNFTLPRPLKVKTSRGDRQFTGVKNIPACDSCRTYVQAAAAAVASSSNNDLLHAYAGAASSRAPERTTADNDLVLERVAEEAAGAVLTAAGGGAGAAPGSFPTAAGGGAGGIVPTGAAGGAGLFNPRNMCYMNHLLQAFVGLLPQVFHHVDGARPTTTPVINALNDILSQLHSQVGGVINTVSMYEVLRKILPEIFDGSQQDAQECLIQLIARLELEAQVEAQQGPFEQHGSLLSHQLTMEMTSEQTCGCGYRTRPRLENHTCLLVQLSDATEGHELISLMKDSLSSPVADWGHKDSKPCGGTDGTSTSLITALPFAMAICLQRFEVNHTVDRKIQSHVVISPELDLSSLVGRGVLAHDGTPAVYEVVAVGFHKGPSRLGGHYQTVRFDRTTAKVWRFSDGDRWLLREGMTLRDLLHVDGNTREDLGVATFVLVQRRPAGQTGMPPPPPPPFFATYEYYLALGACVRRGSGALPLPRR